MKLFFPFIILILSLTTVRSQKIERMNCDFSVNNKILVNPFAGGVNSAQFNSMDVDRDGKKDLVVFDRVGNKLNVFLKSDNGAKYIHAPQYNSIFPELTGWVQLIDYNNDGLEDIFTSKEGGFEVWKCSLNGNVIKFTKVKNHRYTQDILSYKDSFGQIKLQCDYTDIPSIVDLDSDGDFDILSFAGTNSIYFYKNLCAENNISADSFRFILVETCWGKFIEHPLNDKILLSDDRDRCASWSFTQPRHIGSTMLTFDADGDGDYDILLGDVGSNKINFIKNGGDKNNAWGTEIIENYPPGNNPVDLLTFIGIFNIDVDGDGIKDLVFSPNATNDEPFPQNVNNIHYYKKNAPGTNTEYELISKDFLSNTMIDLGGRVYPVFIDIDRDSLTDIVVGTGPVIDNDTIHPSRLVLFKNVGTKATPSYKLTDQDFLSFAQISKDLELNYFTPTFGDLDNDGDMDMLVGNHDGSIIYRENISEGNSTIKFGNPFFNYQNLSVNSFSAPLIIDINKDGLKDILMGSYKDYHTPFKYYGSIVYFQNIGSITNPFFNSDPFISPNSPQFGNILLGNLFENTSNAYLSSYTDSNDEYLFAGHYYGKVNVYTNLSEGIFTSLSPKFKDYGNINVGSNSTPAVADIDNDGFLEMLVGTPRGGFELWDTDIKVTSGVGIENIKNDINIYPNPFQSFINIETNKDVEKGQKAIIYDMMGRKISEEYLNSQYNKINTDKLSIGTYFLKIKFSKKTLVYKIIKSTF